MYIINRRISILIDHTVLPHSLSFSRFAFRTAHKFFRRLKSSIACTNLTDRCHAMPRKTDYERVDRYTSHDKKTSERMETGLLNLSNAYPWIKRDVPPRVFLH